MERAASVREVVNAISLARQRTDRDRMVVAVSGFGGSGKSTLARALVGEVDGSIRLRGDDFLNPARSHLRSTNWDGVERGRLRSEVLLPFRAGEQAEFRRFDWSAGKLGPWELLAPAGVLVVDAIGLFHPDLDDCVDVRIWVDVSIETATQQGIARDRAQGRRHDELWREIWVPNELDFVAAFNPRAQADIWYAADQG